MLSEYFNSTPKKSHSRFSYLKALTGLILLGSIGVPIYIHLETRAVADTGVIEVTVLDQHGYRDIAEEIYHQGAVRNPWWLQTLLQLRDDQVEPGRYRWSQAMSTWQIADHLSRGPAEKVIALDHSLEVAELAEKIGDLLNWDLTEKKAFTQHLTERNTNETQDYLLAKTKEFDHIWSPIEQEAVLKHWSRATDLPISLFPPALYILDKTEAADLAQSIQDQKKQHLNGQGVYLPTVDLPSYFNHLENKVQLLPNMAILPAGDLTLKQEEGRVRLYFSTTYWNKGHGPLELIADPEAVRREGDVETSIFQRLYHLDGSYSDVPAGVFLWHHPHHHYHFDNFVDYELKVVTDEGQEPVELNLLEKMTFCIIDAEIIDDDLPGAPPEPVFTNCDRERQGVSVGWGDTYRYTLPDQYLDITEVPSGRYRLEFTLNPDGVITEINSSDNFSYVTIDIDKADLELEIVDIYPNNLP